MNHMKRLCFLSPDLAHTHGLVALLKANGIPEQHIYLLARDDIPLSDLPDAGPESDDFLPAYERGLKLGGAAGLAAGLFAMAFPPAGFVVGGGAALLLTLYGAGLGAFMTGLAGAAFPNTRLQKYEEDIAAGKILVMADVPADKMGDYELLIKKEDPALEIHGFEPPAKLIPD